MEDWSGLGRGYCNIEECGVSEDFPWNLLAVVDFCLVIQKVMDYEG